MSNQTVVFYSSGYSLHPFPVYNPLLPFRQKSPGISAKSWGKSGIKDFYSGTENISLFEGINPKARGFLNTSL